MQFLIIGAANFVVGGLIGMTGIAGFLLPILYVGYMNHKKTGALDLSFAISLSAGSFFGAVLGVFLNSMIPEQTVKNILYLVVLVSGISIFMRREKERSADREKEIGTAVVVILVMPLFVAGGMAVRTAVGVYCGSLQAKRIPQQF